MRMMCEGKGCMIKQHVPRILLALLFVVGGLGFLMNFTATTKFVGMGLGNVGLPMSLASLALVIAIVLKLGGGLMLMFNFKKSQAAWMLIIFTVGATLMYHMNWSGDGGQMQMTNFLKNLAIIGGLMLFAKCPCKRCKEAEASCCSTPKTEGEAM